MAILEEELKKQSQMLDEDMTELNARYHGKTIAYHNHQVLAEGNSCVQAISRIPKQYKDLPVVIRTIVEKEIMGGGPR